MIDAKLPSPADPVPPHRTNQRNGLNVILEYWSDGIMGDLVLSNMKEEKWNNWRTCPRQDEGLAEFLLTGRLIND